MMTFKRFMQTLGFIALCIGCSSVYADEYILSVEEWSIPRSAEVVLGYAPVQSVVQEWMTNEAHHIELIYPGGEQGELWVSELSDWLVALGIPQEKIISTPGSGDENMRLQVIDNQ